MDPDFNLSKIRRKNTNVNKARAGRNGKIYPDLANREGCNPVSGAAMAEEHEADKPPPGLAGNVDSFNMSALRAVSKACKMSNSLPSENKADHDYYSSFAGFRSVMDSCTSRVESVMAAICKHNAIKSGHGFSGSSAEDMLEFLQDFNDQMLEKANNSLDEASGIKSKMANRSGH